MDTFVILIVVGCVAIALIVVIAAFVVSQQRQCYFLGC